MISSWIKYSSGGGILRTRCVLLLFVSVRFPLTRERFPHPLGFNFGPAIGELLLDLILDGPALPLDRFKLTRFGIEGINV